MAKKITAPTAPIVSVWNMTQEELDHAKIEDALEFLEIQAQTNMLERRGHLKAANKALTGAKMDALQMTLESAKTGSEFSRIVDAQLAVRVAERKLNEAEAVYQAILGKPSGRA